MTTFCVLFRHIGEPRQSVAQMVSLIWTSVKLLSVAVIHQLPNHPNPIIYRALIEKIIRPIFSLLILSSHYLWNFYKGYQQLLGYRNYIYFTPILHYY